MKLTISQERLSQALNLVSKAVSSRTLNLVLAHVRLQAKKKSLTLTGSDGDFTIEHTLEINCDREGALLVPARLFVDLVSRLPKKDVTLERQDGVLKVSSGFSVYDINILPDENFPSLPLFEEGKLAQISSGLLKAALNRTVFSASKDIGGTTSHYTHGVLLNFHEDSLDIVATDGHRLAFEKMDNPSPDVKDRSLLVPTNIMEELRRALMTEEDKTVEFYYLSNQVFFRFNNTTFGGSLFDIRYPDYNKVLPKDAKSIANVNRAALKEALQRVLIVFKIKEQNPVVRLETAGDSIVISSESQDVGKGVEELPFTKGAPFADMRIALNPGYLVDVLSVLDAETVDLHWTSEVNPLKLELAEKPGFVYIVMPIRMD
jgi:DNA polymerase-3 subunit beta